MSLKLIDYIFAQKLIRLIGSNLHFAYKNVLNKCVVREYNYTPNLILFRHYYIKKSSYLLSKTFSIKKNYMNIAYRSAT
jgi:hypothetical protein